MPSWYGVLMTQGKSMEGAPTIASEIVRFTPVGVAAGWVGFMGQYGAAILTTLGIVYWISVIYYRHREHRKRVRNINGQEVAV